MDVIDSDDYSKGHNVDIDLVLRTSEQLQEEIMKLRNGIRKHRDQKGDDNCWLDDQQYLYGLLPEKIKCDPQLPDKELMMYNCSRYYDCRKLNRLYVAVDKLPSNCLKGIYVGDVSIQHPNGDEVTLNVWMNPVSQKLIGIVNMDVDADRNFINDPYDGTKITFHDTFSGLPK